MDTGPAGGAVVEGGVLLVGADEETTDETADDGLVEGETIDDGAIDEVMVDDGNGRQSNGCRSATASPFLELLGSHRDSRRTDSRDRLNHFKV